MSDTSESFHIRSKVWIEDNSGKVIFGLGRVVILEAIGRHGSIHGAAKELGMSYRAVWGRIKATEERLGEELLVRNIGGTSGGGSKLTPKAKMLLEQFHQLHKLIVSGSDKLFENIFSNRKNDQIPP